MSLAVAVSVSQAYLRPFAPVFKELLDLRFDFFAPFGD
jgi:hypothetical protein